MQVLERNTFGAKIAAAEDIRRVCEKIQSLGFRAHVMPGAERTAIGITGNHGPVNPAEFEDLAGVADQGARNRRHRRRDEEISGCL